MCGRRSWGRGVGHSGHYTGLWFSHFRCQFWGLVGEFLGVIQAVGWFQVMSAMDIDKEWGLGYYSAQIMSAGEVPTPSMRYRVPELRLSTCWRGASSKHTKSNLGILVISLTSVWSL